MRLLILVTADHASVDSATGKLYVSGIFNRINARQIPVRHPKLVLVVRIASEVTDITAEQKLEVLLVNEESQVIFKGDASVAMPIAPDGNRPHLDFILDLTNVLFPAQGGYEFSVSIGGELLGTTPIDVVLVS